MKNMHKTYNIKYRLAAMLLALVMLFSGTGITSSIAYALEIDGDNEHLESSEELQGLDAVSDGEGDGDSEDAEIEASDDNAAEEPAGVESVGDENNEDINAVQAEQGKPGDEENASGSKAGSVSESDPTDSDSEDPSGNNRAGQESGDGTSDDAPKTEVKPVVRTGLATNRAKSAPSQTALQADDSDGDGDGDGETDQNAEMPSRSVEQGDAETGSNENAEESGKETNVDSSDNDQTDGQGEEGDDVGNNPQQKEGTEPDDGDKSADSGKEDSNVGDDSANDPDADGGEGDGDGEARRGAPKRGGDSETVSYVSDENDYFRCVAFMNGVSDTVTVMVQDISEPIYIKFVPEYTHGYSFAFAATDLVETSGEAPVYALYDFNGYQISGSMMNAGQIYYVRVSVSSASALGEYEVTAAYNGEHDLSATADCVCGQMVACGTITNGESVSVSIDGEHNVYLIVFEPAYTHKAYFDRNSNSGNYNVTVTDENGLNYDDWSSYDSTGNHLFEYGKRYFIKILPYTTESNTITITAKDSSYHSYDSNGNCSCGEHLYILEPDIPIQINRESGKTYILRYTATENHDVAVFYAENGPRVQIYSMKEDGSTYYNTSREYRAGNDYYFKLDPSWDDNMQPVTVTLKYVHHTYDEQTKAFTCGHENLYLSEISGDEAVVFEYAKNIGTSDGDYNPQATYHFLYTPTENMIRATVKVTDSLRNQSTLQSVAWFKDVDGVWVAVSDNEQLTAGIQYLCKVIVNEKSDYNVGNMNISLNVVMKHIREDTPTASVYNQWLAGEATNGALVDALRQDPVWVCEDDDGVEDGVLWDLSETDTFYASPDTTFNVVGHGEAFRCDEVIFVLPAYTHSMVFTSSTSVQRNKTYADYNVYDYGTLTDSYNENSVVRCDSEGMNGMASVALQQGHLYRIEISLGCVDMGTMDENERKTLFNNVNAVTVQVSRADSHDFSNGNTCACGMTLGEFLADAHGTTDEGRTNWWVDGDGILHFSGNGGIGMLLFEDIPNQLSAYGEFMERINEYEWYKYLRYIRGIDIQEGITFIGDGALGVMVGVESLTIPSSVQQIGALAFSSMMGEVLMGVGMVSEADAEWAEEYMQEVEVDYYDDDGDPRSTEFDLIGIRHISFAANSQLREIGSMAFYASAIEEITLPSSLQVIHPSAFAGSYIRKVVFPANNTISYYTGAEPMFDPFGQFEECVNLREVENFAVNDDDIRRALADFGEGDFDSLSDEEIEMYREFVREAIFEECYNLGIEDEQDDTYGTPTEVGDFVISGQHLIGYNGNDTDIVIPAGVKYIDKGVFKNMAFIESVQLPEGILVIDKEAFKNCTSLEEIDIPDTVTKVGQEAFRDCTSLQRVSVGAETIEQYAFYNCTSLADLTLLDGVKTIDNAFTNCCYETLEIPGSVEYKGYNSMGLGTGNRQLKTLIVHGNNLINEEYTDFNKILGWGYDYAQLQEIQIDTPVITYNTLSNLRYTSRSIPLAITLLEGVEEIEQDACSGSYYGQQNTTVSDLPSSVRVIGDYAFRYANVGTAFTIPKNVESVGSMILDATDVETLSIDAEDIQTISTDAFINNYNYSLKQIRLTGNMTIRSGLVEALTHAKMSQPYDFEVVVDPGVYTIMTDISSLGINVPSNVEIGNTYYITDDGVWYKLDTVNMTAALSYVPLGISTYRVPATLVDKNGNTYNVTAVKENALAGAIDLESVEFASPETIETIEPAGLGNCSTLTSVNGVTTVDDAIDVFEAGVATRSSFMGSGLSDNAADFGTDTAAPFTVQEGGQDVFKLIASGSRNLYTGELATVDMILQPVSSSSTIAGVRIYFGFSRSSGRFNYAPGTSATLITDGVVNEQITVTAHRCDDNPNVQYLEVPSIPVGAALSLHLLPVYPSPSSAGGTANVWAVVMQEGQTYPENTVILSDDGNSYLFTWTTDRNEYSENTWVGYNGRVAGDGNGFTSINEFTMNFDNVRTYTSPVYSQGKAEDHVKRIEHATTMYLPNDNGVVWRQDVVTAIEDGNYGIEKDGKNGLMVYAEIEGKHVPLFHVNDASNLLTDRVNLRFDADDNLVIEWSQLNKQYANADIAANTNLGSIVVGDDIIVITDDCEEDFEIVFTDAVVFRYMHSAHSNALNATANTYYTAEIDVRLDHTDQWQHGIYSGTENSFSYRLHNDGILNADEFGNTLTIGTFPAYFYVKSDRLAELYEAYASSDKYQSLKVTIEHASIVQDDAETRYPTAGDEVTLASGDKNSNSELSTRVLSYDIAGSGNQYGYELKLAPNSTLIDDDVTVTISGKTLGALTVEADIGGSVTRVTNVSDIEEALASIGFLINPRTTYQFEWTFANDFVLYAGAKEEYTIWLSMKSVDMLIDEDVEGRYIVDTSATDNTCVANVVYDGSPVTSAGISYYIYSDRYIYGSDIDYLLNGSDEWVDEIEGALTDGDIRRLHHSFYDNYYVEAKNDVIPVTYFFEGVSAVMVPVDLNPDLRNRGLTVRRYTDAILDDNVTNQAFYVLDQEGVYENVFFRHSSCADTVRVTKNADGLTTEIRFYVSRNNALNNAFLSITDGSLSETGSGYLRQYVYIGDRQGRRMYGGLGASAKITDIRARIFSVDQNNELKNKVYVEQGEKLKLHLIIDAYGVEGGTANYNPEQYWVSLPYSTTPWTIEDLTVTVNTDNASNSTLTGINSFRLSNIDPRTGSEGNQFIIWDDFDLTMTVGDSVTFDIELQMPTDDNDWENYLKAYGCTVFTINQAMNPTSADYPWSTKAELKDDVLVYYQEGVYSTSWEDNWHYNNNTRNGLEYYILVANVGYTRLYLDKIISKLPNGLSYKLKNVYDYNFSLENNWAVYDGSDSIGYTDATGSRWGLWQDYGGYTARFDGAIGTILFDEGSYLNSGSCKLLTFYVDIASEAETNPVLTASSEMIVRNPSGADVLQADGDVVVRNMEEADRNYGNRSTLTRSKLGHVENREPYFSSSVQVSRGPIIPGIVTRAAYRQDSNSAYEYDPVSYSGVGHLVWADTVYNDGKQGMKNYAVTNVIQRPFVYDSVSIDGHEVFTLSEPDGSGNIMVTDCNGKSYVLTIDPATNWSNMIVCNPQGTSDGLVGLKAGMDSDGNTYLTVQMFSDIAGIRIGGSRGFYFSTHATAIQNKLFFNKAYVTPIAQEFNEFDVSRGTAEELNAKPSVKSTNQIMMSYGYVITSEARVFLDGGGSASSQNEQNYAVKTNGNQQVRLSDWVVSRDTDLQKLVIIDTLSDIGDHNPFSVSEARNSEFKLVFSGTRNVSVYANGMLLDQSQYTVEYSSSTDLTAEDWAGNNSGSWSTAENASDRSIRVIIDAHIDQNTPVEVLFNVESDQTWADLEPGLSAWNNFGYKATINAAISMESAPTVVGVKTASIPRMQTELVRTDTSTYAAEDDYTVQYLIYSYDSIGSHYGKIGQSTIDDPEALAEALNEKSFTIVNATILRGASTTDLFSLDGLHLYHAENDGTFTETADNWIWSNGSTYFIYRLDNNDNEYAFYSIDGSPINNVSFVYNNGANRVITAIERHREWSIQLSISDVEGMSLHANDAWIGIYSLNAADAISDDDYAAIGTRTQQDRTIEDEHGTTYYLMSAQQTDRRGTVEWTLLQGDTYIVRELQAPTGYMQNMDDFVVSWIDESGNENSQVNLNVPHMQMGEIPSAGETTEMILYTASAIGVMTAIVFLILGKKKKNKNQKS